MWVPNPDPYEWEPQEISNSGVPFVKNRAVILDRIDENGVVERKKFMGQDAVDEAWASGWHDTNRPETADVVWVEGEEEPKSRLASKSVKTMNKAEKIEYGYTIDLELHDDMSHEEMNLDIKSALKKLEEGEKEDE